MVRPIALLVIPEGQTLMVLHMFCVIWQGFQRTCTGFKTIILSLASEALLVMLHAVHLAVLLAVIRCACKRRLAVEALEAGSVRHE